MKFFKALFVCFTLFITSNAYSRVPDLNLTCYASGRFAFETYGRTLFEGTTSFNSGYSEIKSIFDTVDNISGVVTRGPENQVCIGLLKGVGMLVQSCGPIGKMSEYEDLRLSYRYNADSFYISCGL